VLERRPDTKKLAKNTLKKKQYSISYLALSRNQL
jgi:hypothetical protein